MDIVILYGRMFVGKKGWIIFTIIVAGLLTALVIASHSAAPSIDVSNIDQNTILSASASNGNIADHVYGNASSKVILIEYGDLQCPACGSAHPNIRKISEQYKDQLAFVFRNFPLTTIHPNARAGAAAAEAAGLQGKYWDMNNYLYEHQNDWVDLTGSSVTDAFVSYAKDLGLDAVKFKTALASDAINQKISFDQAIGNKLNVNSTPTFYLNGVQISSDVISDVQQNNGDKLRTLINTDLQKAGIALPANN
jgi:protein-disulfide isomerase